MASGIGETARSSTLTVELFHSCVIINVKTNNCFSHFFIMTDLINIMDSIIRRHRSIDVAESEFKKCYMTMKYSTRTTRNGADVRIH